MTTWSLKAFCELKGIGAASGLVVAKDCLYIVSDHSSFLYQYSLKKQQLGKIALVENAQDIVVKKDKFDIESIVKKEDKLFLFGSGSTQKRNQLFQYDLNSQQVTAINLSEVYQAFKQTIGLSDDELNIEGVIADTTRWLFFQRGNGASAQNGIFILNNNSVDFSNINHSDIEFVPVDLPAINQVVASFTDATLVGNQIYFLAAVENTISTYDDGEVLGSFIGRLDLAQGQVTYIEQITDRHKFEGLTLYQRTDNELVFLLCEDNDTDELSTTIYQLCLNLASGTSA